MGRVYQVHGIDSEYYNIITTPTLQVNSLFTFIADDGSRLSSQQIRMVQQQGQAPVVTQGFSHPGSYLTKVGVMLGSSLKLTMYAGRFTEGFELVRWNGVVGEVGSEVGGRWYECRGEVFA